MPVLVAKLFLLAFAVFGQTKLFPDKEKPRASEMDTIPISAEHPELLLARRAMAAEGLCRASDDKSDSVGAKRESGRADAEAPVGKLSIVQLVDDSCP